MTTTDTRKEAVTRAAKTVTDATAIATARAKEVTTATAKTVVDNPVVTRAKEVTTATAKTVNDNTLVVRVKELGSSAVSTSTDAARNVLDKASTAAATALEMVGGLPLGGKNVGERAQRTVDTVQDKIDVEQIQDQVAKLRHQIDGVVESWQESFRPSATQRAETKAAETVKNAEASTKTTTKKAATTAKKTATATKKAAPKTTAAKKAATTAKKTATATKKAAPKTTAAKK